MRREIAGLMEAIMGGPVSVIEGCCGGAWESFGFRKEYRETFDRFLHGIELNPPERIVVSCPHCYDVLWRRNGERLRSVGVGTVLRLTEMVLDASSSADYEEGEEKRIAFHDSCIFGRRMGVYDEPREVLSMCAGVEVVEMDRVRESSQCCGFPLMAEAPEAAASMAQRVADSAIEAGADTLVSSGCPGCYYALERTTGIRVEDLSGFLYNKYKAVRKR
jgi:Fe-S oxidoreductase